MSRTIRKDKYDKKYSEGQTKKARYRCNCSYCTGIDKQKLIDVISKREMKKEIQEYSSIG